MTQTLDTAPTSALPASHTEIEQLMARGRRLQAEAVQDGFRSLFRFLVNGCSLRVLRLPGPLPGQRQSCC